MKTGDVKLLVEEVLSSLSKPYTEHVIDEVFQAIEQTAAWRLEYDRLCNSLGKALTNNSVGYWVASALSRQATGGRREEHLERFILNSRHGFEVVQPEAKRARSTEHDVRLLSFKQGFGGARHQEAPRPNH